MATGTNIKWFKKARILYIDRTLKKFGYINRLDLVREFEISVPQASNDLKTYMSLVKSWKLSAMNYNFSTHRYERVRS